MEISKMLKRVAVQQTTVIYFGPWANIMKVVEQDEKSYIYSIY